MLSHFRHSWSLIAFLVQAGDGVWRQIMMHVFTMLRSNNDRLLKEIGCLIKEEEIECAALGWQFCVNTLLYIPSMFAVQCRMHSVLVNVTLYLTPAFFFFFALCFHFILFFFLFFLPFLNKQMQKMMKQGKEFHSKVRCCGVAVRRWIYVL